MALFESEAVPRPRRRAAWLAWIGVALLACGAYVAWRASRPAPRPLRSPPAPASRARPALAPGGLDVSADVAGAVVTLDGRALGPAPRQMRDLAPGRHVVRVEAPGRLPYEVEVHVIPGRVTPLDVRLRSSASTPVVAPSRARSESADELHVDADVPGASVFVDHRLRGSTPLVLRDVPAGSHRVNVTAEGYEMQGLDVEVAGPTRVRVSFKEVRLDESTDVQHKHAFGSCEGRLTATLDGLSFAPTKPGHGFRTALADLRGLEVDYLKKELRVKAGGKSWTFTTRAPNADPLLTFQQKVTAARRR